MPHLGFNRFPTLVIGLILTRQRESSVGKGNQDEMGAVGFLLHPLYWCRKKANASDTLLGGISSPLFSCKETWLLALDPCRFQILPFQPDFRSALSGLFTEGREWWKRRAVKMPYIQSPCSVSLGQLISMDLMVTVTLLIPQTFFLFYRVSHSLSRRTQNTVRADIWWLQTKPIHRTAKPSQLKVKTILRKRAVYPGHGSASKDRAARPVSCSSQSCHCQVTWKPRSWFVSTGNGAICRVCRTLTSGHQFSHRYARLCFQKW